VIYQFAYIIAFHSIVQLTHFTVYSGGSSDIERYEDIKKFQTSTGCSSVMLARVAQWNPSIFSADGMRPLDEVIKSYIRYVCSQDCCVAVLYFVNVLSK